MYHTSNCWTFCKHPRNGSISNRLGFILKGIVVRGGLNTNKFSLIYRTYASATVFRKIYELRLRSLMIINIWCIDNYWKFRIINENLLSLSLSYILFFVTSSLSILSLRTCLRVYVIWIECKNYVNYNWILGLLNDKAGCFAR